MQPQEFLAKAVVAANEGGHPFPEYAACEAALESNWDKSQLAQHNNLFGQKFPKSIHFNFPYTFVSIPTHEHNKNDKDTGLEPALWVVFPDWATCFRERMNLLRRLSTALDHTGKLEFPHYAAALLATDGPSFVTEVSKDWASDQERANKVLRTYRAHFHTSTPPAVGPDENVYMDAADIALSARASYQMLSSRYVAPEAANETPTRS